MSKHQSNPYDYQPGSVVLPTTEFLPTLVFTILMVFVGLFFSDMLDIANTGLFDKLNEYRKKYKLTDVVWAMVKYGGIWAVPSCLSIFLLAVSESYLFGSLYPNTQLTPELTKRFRDYTLRNAMVWPTVLPFYAWHFLVLVFFDIVFVSIYNYFVMRG